MIFGAVPSVIDRDIKFMVRLVIQKLINLSKSFNDNTIKLHRQSLVNEIKRKENAEKDRLIKIQVFNYT